VVRGGIKTDSKLFFSSNAKISPFLWEHKQHWFRRIIERSCIFKHVFIHVFIIYLFIVPDFDVKIFIFVGMVHLGGFFGPFITNINLRNFPGRLIVNTTVNLVFRWPVINTSVFFSHLNEIALEFIMFTFIGVSSMLYIQRMYICGF